MVPQETNDMEESINDTLQSGKDKALQQPTLTIKGADNKVDSCK